MKAVRLVSLLAALPACTDSGDGASDDGASFVEPEPLLHGQAQRERLCGRGRSDLVIDAFCTRTSEITGFGDLRRAIGIRTGLEPDRSYATDFDGFALSGHSTSLVARSVSAVNPRAIFVRPESERVELAITAFARGEQFSESVVRDRDTGELRFYLAVFRQACNDAPGGCTHGDLLTESADVGWRDVDVYSEEDLFNTTLDCMPCHQPDGPGTPKLLRMQELDPPWNHWLYAFTDGGRALIADYLAAKGEESFVDVPASAIERSNPGLLSSTVRVAGPVEQPNVFESSTIEAEVRASAAEQGGNQPADNSVPGESETWRGIYERSKRGEAIPVPYHDVKVTDAAKLASMTQAYADYRAGRLPRSALPDIRDVYPDDSELLARMGFSTEPGLDGEGVLLQACASCHNGRLDQTLSRARFDVDLAKLTRRAKQRAIARILLPDEDPGHMPPARQRTLSEEGKARLVELLQAE